MVDIIDVRIPLYFHTVKSRPMTIINNFVVILNQIYRQKQDVEEIRVLHTSGSKADRYEVYVGGTVQEISIWHRMHTNLPVVFIVGELLLP
jgi:hypothetical protein